MKIFFADDSATNGNREGMGRLIAFGGLLLPMNALSLVEERIDGVLEDLNVPLDTEIKWSPPRDNWIRENLEGERREELYRRVIAAAREEGGRAIVSIIDTGRTTIEGRDAFEWSVKFVFERLTVNLAKADDHAIVVADRPSGGRRDEDQFLGEFLERVQEGTQYVPPDRVLLNILTTPSRLVRQLQIADLVTAVTTAVTAGYYRYARPVFEEIEPMLISNVMGYVGGTGLKIFPDETVNLYHWVLGEGAFTKAKSGLGFGLPSEELPYYSDEGILA